MNMQIKAVADKDFPAWRRMRKQLYAGLDDNFNDEEIALIAAAPDKACFLVYEQADKPIGLIELSLRNVVDDCLSSPVGYVEGIYLEPEYRGLGYGRTLIEFAADWFRARGCSEMATDVEISNDSSQRFHEHLGFVETYRIVQYKKGLKAT